VRYLRKSGKLPVIFCGAHESGRLDRFARTRPRIERTGEEREEKMKKQHTNAQTPRTSKIGKSIQKIMRNIGKSGLSAERLVLTIKIQLYYN
jgi:hypothetical protein